jgi:uncharacterized membrane protein YphA (DoxX/SURF4 family)
MFRRIINTSSTWVTVPLRLALAAVFMAHGAQKVLGSFGGHGFNAWISGPALLISCGRHGFGLHWRPSRNW